MKAWKQRRAWRVIVLSNARGSNAQNKNHEDSKAGSSWLKPMTDSQRPAVLISARGEERVRSRHPWIYRSDVVDVHADGGDIVEVIAPRRRRIGSALFSDQSQISL